MASTEQQRITLAGRQLREWEAGLVRIISESGDIAEAIEWSGYEYADIKGMAERTGVTL